MTEVTLILDQIPQGTQRRRAAVAAGLRRARKLAAQRLAQEKPGQTLQATALVHEAYLRLVGVEQAAAVEQPRPLLRRRGRGHAPHPHRERPPQAGRQGRRRLAAAGAARRRTGRGLDRGRPVRGR